MISRLYRKFKFFDYIDHYTFHFTKLASINRKIMNHQQKCSQCLEHFIIANPPRLMPSCQHNICTKCLKEVIQHRQQFIDCQFCQKRIKRKQIKLFAKNLKLIQKIKMNNTACSSSKQSKSINTSKMTENSNTSNKQEDELLINTQQTQSQNNQNSLICQIHHKQFEIICATDKNKICSHCAIFGNHKDHRFKTFVQFQNDINQKTSHFMSILAKKQETQNFQNISNIKHNLNLKIESRKKLLREEIQRSFNQIIDEIKKVQKSTIDQLEQKFKSTSQKINESLTNQLKIKKSYQTWQMSCKEIVSKLKFVQNIQNRVQIYYDSPLQICQEGQFYLQQMTKNMMELYKQTQEQINAISIKAQEKSLEGFLTLIFPILDESTLSKQLAKMQESFQKDFASMKNQPPTREDLNQNSFIFEPEIQSKQNQTSKNQKRYTKINLNKSVTSINSLNSITNLSVFTTISPRKNKNLTNLLKEKQLDKTLVSRVKPGQRRFGSPDFSKTATRNKKLSSPQDVLIELASNDFVNQVDLSQMQLNDKDIEVFIKKAKAIRPLKAIKLQKNKLTDFGFEAICQSLQHVFNVNLSYNNLTQKCLDTILKNKDYLYKMRIINLSHNRITSDKTNVKIKQKLQQIKKMGLVISL